MRRIWPAANGVRDTAETQRTRRTAEDGNVLGLGLPPSEVFVVSAALCVLCVSAVPFMPFSTQLRDPRDDKSARRLEFVAPPGSHPPREDDANVAGDEDEVAAAVRQVR